MTVRIRSIVSASCLAAAVALALAAAAAAATPVVTIGPADSPSGGSATGTVDSSGQTDACLDQQHSGVNPSGSSSSDLVQLSDRSCTTTAGGDTSGGSGGGGGSTAGAGAGGTSGGGGGTSSGPSQSGTESSSSQTSTHTATATATRSAAGLSASRSTKSTSAFVTAAGAHGVVITHVGYKFLRAKSGKHLRILVTVHDRRRHPVRFAGVSLGKLIGAKSTLRGVRLGFSNRKGQAAFVLPVTRPMLGRRLLVRIVARTPDARALTFGSVAVPKRGPQARARR